jgi:hypothetical protein
MENSERLDNATRYHAFKNDALAILERLHIFIEQEDILVVPISVLSDRFSTRSTVLLNFFKL